MYNIIYEYNQKNKEYDIPQNALQVYLFNDIHKDYLRMSIWKNQNTLKLFIKCEFIHGDIYHHPDIGKLQKISKGLFPNKDHSDIYKTLSLINWFSVDKITATQRANILYSKPISIPFSSIQYYQQEGEIRRELQITGGGGGGSSVKGAIAGGLIAGGAGAIIGSRKKVNEIQSETVEIDDRRLVLYYIDKGMTKKMVFHHEDIHAFRSLIPEKEYGYQQREKDKSEENRDIPEQIEKLFQLMEKGIIAKDEFIEKKKELLNKM